MWYPDLKTRTSAGRVEVRADTRHCGKLRGGGYRLRSTWPTGLLEDRHDLGVRESRLLHCLSPASLKPENSIFQPAYGRGRLPTAPWRMSFRKSPPSEFGFAFMSRCTRGLTQVGWCFYPSFEGICSYTSHTVLYCPLLVHELQDISQPLHTRHELELRNVLNNF